MTVQQLAELAGLSQPYLTRIENGERGLSVPVAERIAMSLGASVQDVLGLKEGGPLPPGLSEDAAPYVAASDDLLAPALRRRPNVVPYKVKTRVLDQIGLLPDDIVLIDISATAVDAVKPLQVVIAQVYDPTELLKATTILRQFVPPAMLVTNSSRENDRALNINTEDVHIKGVVVATHRSMSGQAA